MRLFQQESPRLPFPILLLGGGALACAQNAVPLGLDATATLVQESTGVEPGWEPYAAPLDRVDQERVVAEGLSLAQALSLTLRHRQALQADLFEVGLAQADRVQAGLLSNPTLDLAVRFPGDATGNLIDAMLGFQLLELWRIPPRERAADYALEATVASTARTVAGHLVETRRAYWAATFAAHQAALAQEAAALAHKESLIMEGLHAHGVLERSALEVAEIESSRMESEHRRVVAEAEEARRELARAMSLQVAIPAPALTDPLPAPRPMPGEIEPLVEEALAQRLDLQALAWKVEVLEELRSLQGRAGWGDLAIGPNFEDPGDADSRMGPALSWTLPLFDRNQAGIAKAEFALEQARHQWAEAQAQVAQDVRSAWASHRRAWEEVQRQEVEVLRSLRHRQERLEESYRLGATSQVEVLQVRRQVLAVEQESTDLALQLLLAEIRLEQALGRPLGTTVDE